MDGWQVNSQKSLDNAMKLYYNSNNINGINYDTYNIRQR